MSAIRRRLLTAASNVKGDPLAGVNIGDPFMGGYYAGIIDTTRGNIIAADDNQVGKRYALIVSPQSLESWQNHTNASGVTPFPTGCRTRWDGLTATTALATDAGTWNAADYCYGLTYPADAASRWYLPAMDELEVLYRNLKPDTGSNSSFAQSGTFPGGSQAPGYNPSSDPTGAAYTSTDPAQTTATIFQKYAAEALDASTTDYWSSTELDDSYAWGQRFTGSLVGRQDSLAKNTACTVRPVRRLLL